MKIRTAILLVAALLLLGGTALAQTGGPGWGYSVQAGTVAGGGYQLTSLRWQVSGAADGGPYRLAVADGIGDPAEARQVAGWLREAVAAEREGGQIFLARGAVTTRSTDDIV